MTKKAKGTQERSTFEATVDSIDEGIAVLDAGDGRTVRLPSALLPPGATEGARLSVALTLTPGATARAKDQLRALQASARPTPDTTDL